MERTQQQLVSRVIIFTTIVIGLLYITKPSVGKNPDADKPTPVKAFQVTCGMQPKLVKLYGEVVASQPINLDSQVSAAIKAVHKKAGDLVKNGDVLLEFDTNKLLQQQIALKHQIKQAEAAIKSTSENINTEQALLDNELALLDRAQDELSRYESLSESYKSKSILKNYQDAVSLHEKQKLMHQNTINTLQNKLLADQSNLSIVVTQLAQTEIDLDHTAIKSPIDGIIQQIFVEDGDYANPGTPLYTIVNPQELMINAYVPAQYLPNLKALESKAYISLSMQPLTLKRISRIIADGSAHLDAKYTFDTPPPKLALGHTIAILSEIQLDVESCPIPESSLYNDQTIYKIENDQLRSIHVERLGLTYQGLEPYHLISADENIQNQYILKSRLTKPRDGIQVTYEEEQ